MVPSKGFFMSQQLTPPKFMAGTYKKVILLPLTRAYGVDDIREIS